MENIVVSVMAVIAVMAGVLAWLMENGSGAEEQEESKKEEG